MTSGMGRHLPVYSCDPRLLFSCHLLLFKWVKNPFEHNKPESDAIVEDTFAVPGVRRRESHYKRGHLDFCINGKFIRLESQY